MIIKLCNVLDGDNVVNKTFTDLIEVEIFPRKDFDIVRPNIILSSTDDLAVSDFNYVIIPDINRNYFIRSSRNLGNVIFSLDCECDVLETYKNDVLNSVARYQRNIESGDYINTTVDTSTKKIITKHLSSVDVSDQTSMIMTTIGEG